MLTTEQIMQVAIKTGLIVVDEQNITYWTENDASEVLPRFVQAILKGNKNA